MKRTLTGLSLFTILFGFILLTGVEAKGIKIGQFVFDAIVLFFAAASSYEIYKVFKSKEYNPTFIPVIVFLAAVYPLICFFGFTGYAAAAGSALFSAFGFFIFDGRIKIHDFLFTLLMLIYPVFALSLSFWLTVNFGMIPLLIAVGAAMCSDTMAFYMGSLIKGPKIFPKISPKKTYSGSAFGIVGGILGSILVYLLFELANLPLNDAFRVTEQIKYPILFYILMGAAIGVISEIGDLAASRLKRELQIKDFSKAFGSHGGIMDRLDSILFAVVFMAIVMAFVG